jgi:hypothetical protein
MIALGWIGPEGWRAASTPSGGVAFIMLWDGMVSMLRIYSSGQMRQLTADLQAPDYHWELGHITVLGIPDRLAYLIGQPVLKVRVPSGIPDQPFESWGPVKLVKSKFPRKRG